MNDYVTVAELIKSVEPFLHMFMFTFFVSICVVVWFFYKLLFFITDKYWCQDVSPND